MPTTTARLSSMKSSAVSGWKGMWAKYLGSDTPPPPQQPPQSLHPALTQPMSEALKEDALISEHVDTGQPLTSTVEEEIPMQLDVEEGAILSEKVGDDHSLTPSLEPEASPPSATWYPASASSVAQATQIPEFIMEDEMVSSVTQKDSADTTNPSAFF